MTVVTKTFAFSAGHTLALHPGKCRHMHGHNYSTEVSVDGKVDPDDGMVIDFSDLKEIVSEVIDIMDHQFIIWEGDPRLDALRSADPESLMIVDFHPTAENLAVYLKETIQYKLDRFFAAKRPNRIRPWVSAVVLWETDTCYASV